MSDHGSEAWSGGLRNGAGGSGVEGDEAWSGGPREKEQAGGSGVEATVSGEQQDVKGWRGRRRRG